MGVNFAFYRSHGRDFPVFRPQSIDEVGEIADALRHGEIIDVDLTGTPKKHVQRIEDFMNGAARVRGGTVHRGSDAMYRVIPAAPGSGEDATSTSPDILAGPHGWAQEATPDGSR